MLKEIGLAKPFIKWVGGKGKLVPELVKMFPKKFNNYFEPFIGGGALFYEVKQKYEIGFSSINDINKKLIIAYKQIQQSPNKLIKLLKNIEIEYKNLSPEEQEKYFYMIRKKYNEENLDSITTTSYLIFLNKTCFNGMYRENSKGQYNIPFGDQKNPTICDEKNILNVSECLKNTEIMNSSFEESIKKCQKGDFIYFDPPYYPINVTSSFTSYHKNSFGPDEQKRLRDVFINLTKKGCFVMLSNSNADFIRELYKDFNINEIYASRSINSNGNKRGKIKEVVITNYK
ncbi:MAG: DNA adenine methylase [Candidatus Shapirobacteria bacterium]|nr:DNA adenine methylase [Candidatus Shapirobacteria bacterium]